MSMGGGLDIQALGALLDSARQGSSQGRDGRGRGGGFARQPPARQRRGAQRGAQRGAGRGRELTKPAWMTEGA